MGQRARGLTVAVLMTILDAVVVSYYGPMIWQVWSVVPWINIALLLLAGTGAFSLADIWAHAFRCSRGPARNRGVDVSEGMATLSGEVMEGADV